MKIALGSDIMPEDGPAGGDASSSSSGQAQAVEAEVVTDPNDPWGKK